MRDDMSAEYKIDHNAAAAMPVTVVGDDEADRAFADCHTLAAAVPTVTFEAASSLLAAAITRRTERDEAVAALADLLKSMDAELNDDPEIRRCRAIVARYGK